MNDVTQHAMLDSLILGYSQKVPCRLVGSYRLFRENNVIIIISCLNAVSLDL